MSQRSTRRLSRSAITSSAVRALEMLETRTFLCAVDHVTAGGLLTGSDRNLPASVEAMFTAGHITQAEYDSLSPEIQSQIDPHEIESNPFGDGPVDFDAILGIPSSVTNGPESGETEVEVLPDFFPQLDSAISVDQTSQSGRTLLRFGTQVNNQGTGPGILISGRPGVDPIPSGAPITSWTNPDGSQNVLQAVYNYTPPTSGPITGGSFSLLRYRAAGTFTYHAGHGHFHFDGYATYTLRHRNPDGTAGAPVMRADGTGVVGTKTGFCLINTSSSFTLESGGSSTGLQGYNGTGQPSTGCGLLQGVLVGRADEYTSGLEGQWIDVTGVPNGQYFVEIKLDGENALQETNENNNAKSWAYTLNVGNPSGGIPQDQFDTGTNNNTQSNARDMGVMGTFNQTGLSIHFGQDKDFFRFEASSSGTYTITTVGTGGSGQLDLYLLDSTGQVIRSSTGTGSSESVSYPFVMGETYYVMTESYNSQTVGNYQITWNLKPTVTNTAAADASEVGAAQGSVVIARNGPTTSPLTVTFTLGGTATFGTDYTIEADGLINNSTISLGDLQSSSTLRIIPIGDSLIEGTETVTVTVNSAAAYVIGGTSARTVNIADTPPQIVAEAWNNQSLPLNVTFDFDMNVGASLDVNDIEVANLDTRDVIPVSGVTYNATLNRATFSLAAIPTDGHYQVTLVQQGVTHALGTSLGADGSLLFNVYAGDANGDDSVDINDFEVLALNFGQPGTLADGDFNYSGTIDIDDFEILAQRFNTSLPAARPQAGTPGQPVVLPGQTARAAFGQMPIGSTAERIDLLDAAGPL